MHAIAAATTIIDLLMSNVETVLHEEWALRNHFKKVDARTNTSALTGAL